MSSNVVCAKYVCGFCCASREVGGGANDNVPGAKENYRLPSCPIGGCIVITGVGVGWFIDTWPLMTIKQKQSSTTTGMISNESNECSWEIDCPTIAALWSKTA